MSKKWGFTNWERAEYEEYAATHRLIPDGAGVKLLKPHGPLSAWKRAQALVS